MIKTRKEFIAYFAETCMPAIRKVESEQSDRPDYPLRAETWNNTIDTLIKDRQAPRCAADWSNPYDRRK